MRYIAILVAFAIVANTALALDWSDDFSGYAAVADGTPNWDARGLGWRVADGMLSGGDGGWPSTLPLAKRVSYKNLNMAATIVPVAARGSNWKVAGIRLLKDDRNYWHLALVEGPTDSGSEHFVELSEMRDGRWLAQSNLRATASQGRKLAWRYNTPYRLDVTLSPKGIEGTVSDTDGKKLAHMAYAFNAEAVTSGRPAFCLSRMAAHFDDFTMHAEEAGAENIPAPWDRPVAAYAVAGSGVKAASPGNGFFRVERADGRDWLVDPRGERFYAVGTDHVNYFSHWCQALGYAPYHRNCEQRYGTIETWATNATTRLRAWGFNLLGAGNIPQVRYQGLAHTLFVAFGSTFSDTSALVEKVHWTGFPNVFDPRWPLYCNARARETCEANRYDPWLLGYFLDNELEWYGKTHRETGIWDAAMSCDAKHTGKIALRDHLVAEHKTLANFNQAWHTTIKAWNELLALKALPAPTDRARDVQVNFLALVADLYFSATAAAIRQADPNHLVIGCRFAGNAPEWAWRACARYCDVVTFNSYPRIDFASGDLRDAAAVYEGYHAWVANRPMMMTEWSFPALDAGLPCQHGAGMRVDTQHQKSMCVEAMQHLLFRLPFMVGSDYFMWSDEPAQGISDTFPEDSNYGLVDVNDDAYPELTRMFAGLNPHAVALHAGSIPEVYIDETAVTHDHIHATLRNAANAPADVRLAVRVPGREELAMRVTVPPGSLPVDIPFVAPDTMSVVRLLVGAANGPEPWGCRGRREVTLYTQNPAVGDVGTRSPAIVNASDQALPAVPFALRGAMPAGAETAPLVIGELPAVMLTRIAGDLAVAPLPAIPAGALLPTRRARTPAPSASSSIRVTRRPNGGFSVDNGVLRLEHDGTSGNVIDRFSAAGLLLGSYNPLIWQAPQDNRWTPADRLVKSDVRELSNCTIVDVTAAYKGEGAPILDSDGEPVRNVKLRQAAPFEVTHRLVVWPNCPLVAATCLSVRNTDYVRPLNLQACFFYLAPNIAGSPEGDEPGGTVAVPNYYRRPAAASWQDKAAGGIFGCLSPDGTCKINFWLDDAGRPHPDARLELDPAVIVPPGLSYEPSPTEILLIYGAVLTGNGPAAWSRVKPMLDAYDSLAAVRPIP